MTFVNAQNQFILGLILALWLITAFVCFMLVKKRKTLESFEETYKKFLNYTGTSYKTSLLRKILLIIFASFVLTIILLRPANGTENTTRVQSNTDIIFVVDTSLSMGVQDTNDSRIDTAKKIMRDIIDGTIADRMGLVSYTNFAHPEVPLTFDKQTLLTGIETLRIVDYNYARGSSLSSGITEGVRRLTAKEDHALRNKYLILLGDGEDIETSSDLSGILNEARNNGVIIISVGIGTEEGGKVPYYTLRNSTTLYVSEEGKDVISKLVTNQLREIASETGGDMYTWDMPEIGTKITNSIERNQRFPTDNKESIVYRELYYLGIPLFLFCVIIYTMKLYERIIPIHTKKNDKKRPIKTFSIAFYPFIYVSILYATFSGNLLYTQRNYEAAQKEFEQIISQDGENSIAHYNLGNSLYRRKEYTKAIQSFKIATESEDKNVKAKSFYNMGNSYYRNGEENLLRNPNVTISQWEEAIKSYEETLKIAPYDIEAAENLEFVKKKLEELRQKTESQQQNPNGSEQKDTEEAKDRIEESEKKAIDRYNRFGRYRNDEQYQNNYNNGQLENPKW